MNLLADNGWFLIAGGLSLENNVQGRKSTEVDFSALQNNIQQGKVLLRNYLAPQNMYYFNFQ